jgi:hypothetical protein
MIVTESGETDDDDDDDVSLAVVLDDDDGYDDIDMDRDISSKTS